MTLLSQKGILAIHAVVDIALYSRDRAVSSADLAKTLHAPVRQLDKIMNALAHAGILSGMRGQHGGYKLAKERHSISAYAIVKAVSTIDTDLPSYTYRGLPGAVVLPNLAQAEQGFATALAQITVEDLVQSATLQIYANDKTPPRRK